MHVLLLGVLEVRVLRGSTRGVGVARISLTLQVK